MLTRILLRGVASDGIAISVTAVSFTESHLFVTGPCVWCRRLSFTEYANVSASFFQNSLPCTAHTEHDFCNECVTTIA
jgi:hypothetical protein